MAQLDPSQRRISADEIIQRFQLSPLPGEGGFYRETYRSRASCRPDFTDEPRAHSTAIYYLLTVDTYSALHRLRSDEIYHFYAGDPVDLHLMFPNGTDRHHALGPAIVEGMEPQVVVPAGTWQGSRLQAGGDWALMGTTVAPGFEFADWELATPGTIQDWPMPAASLFQSLLASPTGD